MHVSRSTSRVIICLTLVSTMLLAGCASTGSPGGGAVVDERFPGDPRQAYERGDYREAALAWQQAALGASHEDASRLRLEAADAWVLAGDPGSAQSLLPWIEESLLTPQGRALLSLITAEIKLDADRALEARQALDRVDAELPQQYETRLLSLEARVDARLGDISSLGLEAAQAIIGDTVGDIQAYDAGAALQLMHELEQLSSGELARLAVVESNPKQAAWFALALVLRENLVDASYLEAWVNDWKTTYPAAPLTEDQALDLWLRYRQKFRPPDQVAVLLPEHGGLKAAATAIRDGIMTAYLRGPGGALIRFYGTNDQPESVLAAYFEAADDGADYIVGPLDRASVEALLNLAGLATPILALNELPDTRDLPLGLEQQVFGMSLSQDREAGAVADRMSRLGFRKVVILAPANTWGERISAAFRDNFLRSGGEILVDSRYMPDENDHSEILESALRIDESKARKQQLENRLGIELEFEPVRRSDVDGIFLAAAPEQGRQLAPQLRFFDAGNIPTFSTSRVFTGVPEPARNQDLDGLHLPLTDWQVRHPTEDSIPDLTSIRGGQFAPFFAIGIDAWNILPWLDLMRRDPDFRFPGETGRWSITTDGTLVREPAWSRFSGGVPMRLPPATHLEQSGVSSR